MADIEQAQQMIPLVTCENSLGQYVGKLVFGVDVGIWFGLWGPNWFD